MQHIKNFFKAVGGFFKEFGVALAKGSIFVKLSIIMLVQDAASILHTWNYLKG
jgi:hypothetical protein